MDAIKLMDAKFSLLLIRRSLVRVQQGEPKKGHPYGCPFLLYCSYFVLDGLERRLLASVLWTLATAVAFPQKSESSKGSRKKAVTKVTVFFAAMCSTSGMWCFIGSELRFPHEKDRLCCHSCEYAAFWQLRTGAILPANGILLLPGYSYKWLNSFKISKYMTETVKNNWLHEADMVIYS